MFFCLSNTGVPSFMQKQAGFYINLFTVWLSLWNVQISVENILKKKFAVSCQFLPPTFIFPEDF